MREAILCWKENLRKNDEKKVWPNFWGYINWERNIHEDPSKSSGESSPQTSAVPPFVEESTLWSTIAQAQSILVTERGREKIGCDMTCNSSTARFSEKKKEALDISTKLTNFVQTIPISTFLCKFHLLYIYIYMYLHSVSTQLSSPLDREMKQHITMLKAGLDTKMFKETTMLILDIYIYIS